MNFQRIKNGLSVMTPFGMMFGSLCMLFIIGINGIPGPFMGPIFDLSTVQISVPVQDLANFTLPSATSHSGNLTAANLQLADQYAFYLWNYAITTGNKTIYPKSGWDYAKDLEISPVLDNNSTSTEFSDAYKDTMSSCRTKLRCSQVFFILAILSTFAVVAMGISGAFGYRAPLLVAAACTGISLVMTLVLAVLITLLIFTTKADSEPFTKFGFVFVMGTSDLGIVWIAAVHILVVGVMWLLMAFGVTKCNGLVQNTRRNRIFDDGQELDEEHVIILSEQRK
ncbi:hypothetical protein P175DRAFT_0531856 [Aspergillus ochraceoroseus IBT 24754]|uniref:Uncharacterized protein n=1 Tax=Aspergillus ochraceoroseus IBT 24754 TaxID=1392256 RepID=A0A2T5LW61_9EURO|nr:uncharacterized protein P175DRAFT_0531856 [Aspergillus ochraceoroseus IBT 24754]PTU20518.1 hypothetical protein P175DRAFT_0531856 [Aspergillus ochraceoroseus IBT 24754]